MTVAFWCVLFAALMPLGLAITAKAGDRSFDNRRTRLWYEGLSGYRQRAGWAQQNSFEALPIFASAVIIAHLAGADPARIDLLAVLFIVSRLVFAGCYLADWHIARSLAWLAGIGCCIALFVAAA
jgi:uncharacterized MAPEG superfamily protein